MAPWQRARMPAEDAASTRARTWLVGGLSGLLTAIALGLGQGGSFAPLLALGSAVAAGFGLHRFGRSGRRALERA